jgi:uncharacterized protein
MRWSHGKAELRLPEEETLMRTTLFAALAAWSVMMTVPLAPAVAQPGAVMPMGTMLSFQVPLEVRKAPDMAIVSAGVVSAAPSARAAMADNAKKMTGVFAALAKAGIAERDIQTQGLNLQPQYSYVANRPPVLTGYQATNMVEVRVRKLDQIGPVLDQLVAQGVNQINGPNFLLADADTALNSARTEAVKAAQARAELYASAAGLKVKRIVSISEGSSGGPPPPMPMLQAKAMDASVEMTPVSPGQVGISSSLTVVVELAP